MQSVTGSSNSLCRMEKDLIHLVNVETTADLFALHFRRYSGFTSCVDLGGYACELQKVIDEGLILGPTLYGSGAAISMTAGHGEIFE